MGTVTIGLNTYTVYGDKSGADTYFAARIGGDTWATLPSGTPEKALKTAADVFNHLGWDGQIAAQGQALAWPRTGVTDRNGFAVDSATVPTDVINGSYELAFALAQNPALLYNTQGTGSKVKSLQSGQERIEYFTWVDGLAFPKPVIDWIGIYLTSGGSLSPDPGTGIASGTTTCPTFGVIRDPDGLLPST